eukprot:1194311-Pleurochrysis_carterae.AAC.2
MEVPRSLRVSVRTKLKLALLALGSDSTYLCTAQLLASCITLREHERGSLLDCSSCDLLLA